MQTEELVKFVISFTACFFNESVNVNRNALAIDRNLFMDSANSVRQHFIGLRLYINDNLFGLQYLIRCQSLYDSS